MRNACAFLKGSPVQPELNMHLHKLAFQIGMSLMPDPGTETPGQDSVSLLSTFSPLRAQGRKAGYLFFQTSTRVILGTWVGSSTKQGTQVKRSTKPHGQAPLPWVWGLSLEGPLPGLLPQTSKRTPTHMLPLVQTVLGQPMAEVN